MRSKLNTADVMRRSMYSTITEQLPPFPIWPFARRCRCDHQVKFQQQGRSVPYGTGRLIYRGSLIVRGTATASRMSLIPPLERPPTQALSNGEHKLREPPRIHIGFQDHHLLQTYAVMLSCFSQPCSITRNTAQVEEPPTSLKLNSISVFIPHIPLVISMDPGRNLHDVAPYNIFSVAFYLCN
jgi:hypothetical protein